MNSTATTYPQITRVSFDDVDLFSDWVKELDWALESTQISSGPYRLDFETIDLPDLSVSHLSTRQTVRDRFSVPDCTVFLSIPRSKLPGIWNGKRLPPSMMGVFHAGIDHWVVMPAGWDGYEFTISEDLVRRTELLPDVFSARARHFENALPLSEPVTGHFIAQLDAYFALARNQQGREGAAIAASAFFDIVMQGLLEIVGAGPIVEDNNRLTAARRADLVTGATDLIDGRLEAYLSIQDLAQELGTSARALNYAFKDTLGISPYQYTLNRKLHAVRRELKTSDDPIAEVISRYGFTTPSRFGRQYQRLFAELPSALRRGRE